MSVAELEKVTKAWPPISHAVRVPHTEADYRDLVELLDRITDKVGEDETHPLASLMDVLGVLIEKYEDGNVSELTSSGRSMKSKVTQRRYRAPNRGSNLLLAFNLDDLPKLRGLTGTRESTGS
jgi:HTH-type transcriptional regulator / antitoxin HigA